MTGTAALTASPAELLPGAGLLFRTSRGVLLFALWFVFAGAMSYLNPFSPLLLYGSYAVIAACIAACLCLDWPGSRRLRSVAPYLIWTFAFFLWGMIAAAHSGVIREGLKDYLKNFLVIGALAIALERGTLKTFAQLVQIAVLANLALCFWELLDPSLVETIAFTREADATAYNIFRPAGLWSNPDESAFAYIFALLISHWARGPLATLGRLAALIGLYLSVSRTGIYLLALCGAAYGWQWLKSHRVSFTRLASWCAAALLVIGAVVAILTQRGFDLADNWQLMRFLDFQENSRYIDDASRTEIAGAALQTILHGPWFGSGLFSFQCDPNLPDALEIPAHNVFLVVWGEAGPLALAAYLAVMAFGFSRVLRTPMAARDRLPIVLLWLSYFVIGVTWHNQFTSFSGMLYIGLLWRLPAVVEDSPIPIFASMEAHRA